VTAATSAPVAAPEWTDLPEMPSLSLPEIHAPATERRAAHNQLQPPAPVEARTSESRTSEARTSESAAAYPPSLASPVKLENMFSQPVTVRDQPAPAASPVPATAAQPKKPGMNMFRPNQATPTAPSTNQRVAPTAAQRPRPAQPNIEASNASTETASATNAFETHADGGVAGFGSATQILPDGFSFHQQS
jgi:hypothetical protein